mmetsp:Transcript_63726/g.109435  ORF Transcript_63726/g.109435 Transcript_63726/m.109435 type:complete len:211 (-) Transcript_63726:69-701(-)
MSSMSKEYEDDYYDESSVFPFNDAFEEDSETYPYGTLTAVASHVTTLSGTTLRLIEVLALSNRNFFVDLGCGIGRVTNLVAETAECPCLGIDNCEGEVLAAQTAHAASIESREARNLTTGVAKYVTCDLMDMIVHLEGVPPLQIVIYIHLIPKQVARPELRAMLEPLLVGGARVVTSVYHPPYWLPSISDKTYDLNFYDAGSLALPPPTT